MSRRLTVALSCFTVLGLSAWAFAQQGRIFQRADGALEVHPPEPVEIEGLGAVPNNGSRQSAERISAGQYQVVAVGDGAILLNTNTGESWYDAHTAEHGRAWLPMKRIEPSDAPGDDGAEAHADSAEAHSHESHSHERENGLGHDHEHAEDGHSDEALIDEPQTR